MSGGGTLGDQLFEGLGSVPVSGFNLLSGFFDPPPSPDIPAVTRPPATPDSTVPSVDGSGPSPEEIRRRARQRLGVRRSQGFGGTLLTGPSGITSDSSQARHKTLLGL